MIFFRDINEIKLTFPIRRIFIAEKSKGRLFDIHGSKTPHKRGLDNAGKLKAVDSRSEPLRIRSQSRDIRYIN